jgi:hypothetical protein
LIATPRQVNFLHLKYYNCHPNTKDTSAFDQYIQDLISICKLESKMTSNADTVLEPKVEDVGAGPKLAETETKLATEPIYGNQAAASENVEGDEKTDASSAASVRDIYT